MRGKEHKTDLEVNVGVPTLTSQGDKREKEHKTGPEVDVKVPTLTSLGRRGTARGLGGKRSWGEPARPLCHVRNEEILQPDIALEDCHSFEDRFLYIMKNLPTFAEKPELWDDPYFEDIMTEAEFANMTDQERHRYIMSMKDKWDNYAVMKTATERGMAQGLEQGLEQGREEVARKMKEDHVPVETIAKYSGLTEEQIKAL